MFRGYFPFLKKIEHAPSLMEGGTLSGMERGHSVLNEMKHFFYQVGSRCQGAVALLYEEVLLLISRGAPFC